MNIRGKDIYRPVRSFLFSIVNREFLIFLFFLVVASTFWLLMALNETYERDFEVPVRLTGVPRDVVITTDMEDTIRVTLRDKGFTLGAYMFGDRLQPLTVSYRNYTAKDNGHAQIPQADLQKQLYQQLFGSSKIVAVKPEKLEFFYNHGISKQVPVRLYGQVKPDSRFYLARTIFSPNTVTVFASKALLDSISYAMTVAEHIVNFQDTVVRTVKLRAIRGAKIVPDEVKVTLCPDILTEETIEVPITAVGMPAGKTLRTFPSRARVRFVIGASQFRQIRPEQFSVEADYEELSATGSDKCNIYLRKHPANVKNAQLEISQVDYLIEQ